jgi:anti-anti-sigma factor
MPEERWSQGITVVRLGDDPQFTEDTDALLEQPELPGDIVIDFALVKVINSSNLAALLKLRRRAASQGKRLVLCGIHTPAWSAFLLTGLDKVFQFSQDVPTALAGLQIK